jgi:hypothetical protein
MARAVKMVWPVGAWPVVQPPNIPTSICGSNPSSRARAGSTSAAPAAQASGVSR